MKFIIKHEIKGRIRISLARKFHTVREADVLEQYLLGLDGVTAAKVYERTADTVPKHPLRARYGISGQG